MRPVVTRMPFEPQPAVWVVNCRKGERETLGEIDVDLGV